MSTKHVVTDRGLVGESQIDTKRSTFLRNAVTMFYYCSIEATIEKGISKDSIIQRLKESQIHIHYNDVSNEQ